MGAKKIASQGSFAIWDFLRYRYCAGRAGLAWRTIHTPGGHSLLIADDRHQTILIYSICHGEQSTYYSRQGVRA